MLLRMTVFFSAHLFCKHLRQSLKGTDNQEKSKEKNKFVGAVCPYLKGAMPNTISLDQLWNAE